MDALAGLLDGPRARGAFLLRSVLSPPWSLRIEDRAPLTLMAVLEGTAWVVPEDGSATRLRPRDVAVVRGPRPYTVADGPATPPHAVIGPGQRCTTLAGAPLADLSDLGVRTWGTDSDGTTVLLTGTYQVPDAVGRRLLDALPRLVVLPEDAWSSPIVPLLAEEVGKQLPGQEAVLDRLLDLLLIAVLRAWFARPEADAPAWYRAHGDPVVGRALRLLHREPARPWTVAALAAEAGVSRAALARRFTALVGEPPMAYLTAWRLTLAADLLRESDAPLDAVARRVGYGSGFALSAAFKRERGISPQRYRAGGPPHARGARAERDDAVPA
ncbi:AraC family transcriptional regulator [Marinitenerispora sediminis]|uniref:AraC family transcriptional regulator n=1 Tax=Marinitenerispora sediminis TaxID=1931232 RepID=A0A368T617_9ACTN|nr:AraC family transcriptional regulator [Marinitenerispora sediminis]RCV51712.1 AraC family transcriptional regulator [Marinitenerispora sediminis]RCV55095.1 AraC family transcriptional regulator [Marinitenerispora sediminis]RCV59090.1 AraC family transcriptional regulator [Marinitenerispora sediminis]